MQGYLPWRIIGIVAGVVLPMLLLSLWLGLGPAQPLIGYIIGMLACLSADRRWAAATPVISVAAYLAVLWLPLPASVSIYLVAIALVALIVMGRHIGAAAAYGQAAFGWVFLTIVPGMEIGAWDLAAHIAGGLLGAGTAMYLGLESFRRPAESITTAPDLVLFASLACGFLLSIAAGRALHDAHGYWIPFVFLQVAMAADTHHPVIAMQRVAGATAGIFTASLAGEVLDLPLLRLFAVAGCVIFGLRLLAVRPILSRALMTGAIVLMLTRPGDTEAAEVRLLSEVLGVVAVLLTSGLYMALSYLGGRRTG